MSRRSGKPTDISKQQRALQADTAERLEAIVEAAERAAQRVIDDAEEQARGYLAQARAEAERINGSGSEELSGQIDSLLAQTRDLRRQAEQLQAMLEAAKEKIEFQGPQAPPGSQEPQDVPRLRAVDTGEAPAPQPDDRRADAAGARLLATQMAVSGSSREEIEQRLRNGFEIVDAEAIIDAILGPED